MLIIRKDFWNMKSSSSIYKIAIIKGISNGVSASIIINLWVILSLYYNFSSTIFYLMGLPLSIISYFLLKQFKIKYYLAGLISCILSYLLITIMIDALGVVHTFYYNLIRNDIEMSAGTGFGIVVIYICNYCWFLMGVITAFISTIYKVKNGTTNKSKK